MMRRRPRPGPAEEPNATRPGQECVAATQTNDAGPDALIAEIAVTALARLAGGATLEVLQRNTLVPLELALAAQPALAPTSSLELGRALASALPKRLSPLKEK